MFLSKTRQHKNVQIDLNIHLNIYLNIYAETCHLQNRNVLTGQKRGLADRYFLCENESL